MSDDWYVIEVIGRRGEQFGRLRLRAEDEDDAHERFEDYDGYEVAVEHENGGSTWETVFATSEEKAREKAFERELEYMETGTVQKLDLPYSIDVTSEEEFITPNR